MREFGERLVEALEDRSRTSVAVVGSKGALVSATDTAAASGDSLHTLTLTEPLSAASQSDESDGAKSEEL